MKRLDSYSQNFIRNPGLIKSLISKTSINSNDYVIDIGAGSGVISLVLADHCKSVLAVEFEPKTVEKLRQNMIIYKNVEVYEGDFLQMNLPKVLYKIFANIPFHLSSPIIHKITESINPPQDTYLIVQKQFGEKLVATSDKFKGQLGMQIAPEFSVKIIKNLKKTDFWPHPNVDTVFIEIKKRDTLLLPKTDIPSYKKFVSDCFSDPKIFNKTPRFKIGLPETIKPSQMKISQWIELFLQSVK